MKKITAILIGAGSRGMNAYASYALNHPNEIQFVAVAEPDIEKREKFRKMHGIPEECCFLSWEEIFEKDQFADAVFICTQDRMHFGPAIKSLEKGYHILLEKPISDDINECIILEKCAKKNNRLVTVCHVLRYTEFFTTLKRLLDSSCIGKLVSIQHNENVAFWHQAHSFVRGNWRNSDESSPMILAKCCHDMDILLWLAGADCRYVSSFGSLTNFKKESAPEGAPTKCLDGCPAERDCPYHAAKIYLTEETNWPTSVICNDMSIEARTKALMEGPYGRCVYHCDNNVVDHQVVNMEFKNDVTAAFTMCAFTNDCSRTIKLMGTNGEIRGAMEKDEIEIINFNTGTKQTIHLNKSPAGHGGGDFGIMYDFVRLLQKDDMNESLTSIRESVLSHIIAFAAEKSRLEKKIIDLDEYKSELETQINPFVK